jgi:hypothetical protein
MALQDAMVNLPRINLLFAADKVLSQLHLPADYSSVLVAEELEIRIVGICPGCGRSERNPAGSSKIKKTGRRSVSRKKEKSLWLS